MAQLSPQPQTRSARSASAAAAAAADAGAYNPLVLARVLKQAAQPNNHGALHVVSGPSVKTIRFGRGSVRFAASNIRRDRLGETMLAHDFISRSDFRVATDTMKRSGCRFGEALVSMGRVTENELKRELAIQAQRIVLSLFRIEEGTYRLESGEPATAKAPALPVGLPVPPLLLKGLRSIKDGRLILSELPPAETLVRASASRPSGFKIEKLSPAERSVLEYAGAGRTIGEIIRGSEFGRVDAFHGCFALLALGLLERVTEGESGPSDDDTDTGTGLRSSLPSPAELEAALETLESSERPDAAAPPRARGDGSGTKVGAASPERLIRLQFERLDSVSETGLLGVREDVSREELDGAYRELKREWADLRGQTEDRSLLVKLDAIERRLAAAYASLRFQLQTEASMSPAEETAPAFADLSAGTETFSFPDSDLDPDPEPEREPERVSKLEPELELHLELESEPEPGLESATPALAVPPSDGRVEQLERDLDLHFQVRDWGGAISLLHELVTLHPESARYHAQLGTAMQHHSGSRINAEQHFLEAVRLSPDDAAIHLDLARYYQLLGDAPRARPELQRTLELDPGNEEALRLLGTGKPRSTMKSLLNKVFGA